MVVTPLASVAVLRFVHIWNAPPSMLVTLPGMVTFVEDQSNRRTRSPAMLLTPSTDRDAGQAGAVTRRRLSPMLVTLLGDDHVGQLGAVRESARPDG